LAVEDGAAVFAVPDKHLLGRCEETRGDAEAALAARFGVPVPLRLVLDPGGPSVDATAGGASVRPGLSDPPGGLGPRRDSPPDIDDTAFDYAGQDVDDLAEAGPAVTSPEQRLLEAFPGAKEVSP
jgi:hypothetical protein